MTMICSILSSWTAWFIPHLIVNNSALVEVCCMMDHFNDWWVVRVNMSYQSHNVIFDAHVQYYDSGIRICQSIKNNFIKIFKMRPSGINAPSIWPKKKQLENRSTNLLLGENSGLNGSKNLKIPFNLLFASTIGPLTFNFCLSDKFSINS